MNNNYWKHYNFLGKRKRPMKISKKHKKVYKIIPSEDNKNLRLWSVFKFTENMAWYAVCPTCNYNYFCSETKPEEYNPEEEVYNSPITKVTKLYKFCPECGQRFNIKLYVDYTDINIPAIEGFDSLVDIIKTYNHFDSVKDKEEQKKALDKEYNRQWKAYYGNMEKD